MNDIKFTHLRHVPRKMSGGEWYDMKIATANGEYHATALIFDEGSQYGINEGRISKLNIVNPHGDFCYNYDRGEDISPVDSMAKKVLEFIVIYFES